jgi:hypothetical protein
LDFDVKSGEISDKCYITLRTKGEAEVIQITRIKGWNLLARIAMTVATIGVKFNFSRWVLSTTTTNWISSGYLNLKIPLEDILLENSLVSYVGSVSTCFITDVLVTGEDG